MMPGRPFQKSYPSPHTQCHLLRTLSLLGWQRPCHGSVVPCSQAPKNLIEVRRCGQSPGLGSESGATHWMTCKLPDVMLPKTGSSRPGSKEQVQRTEANLTSWSKETDRWDRVVSPLPVPSHHYMWFPQSVTRGFLCFASRRKTKPSLRSQGQERTHLSQGPQAAGGSNPL